MRSFQKILGLSGLAVLLSWTAPGVQAYQPDFAEDVSINSDPSPSQAESRINNYLFQDEQLNLTEESGTIRVLRTDQKAGVNDFVTAIIPLDNVCPRELRGLARTIARKEGGDADVFWDKIEKQTGKRIEEWQDCGKNLVVVCPEFQLPYLLETFKSIDHEWVTEFNNGSWLYYYKAKNRNISDVMSILRFYATPDGDFSVDQANNAVLRSDQPCIAPLFIWGLSQVDIPPSQMSLDVAITETNAQDDLLLGFDFENWKNGPGQNLFRFLVWDITGNVGGAQVDSWGNFRSYNFLASTAYLDFMRSKGEAELLAKTTLVAKSGTSAQLRAFNQVVSFDITSQGYGNGSEPLEQGGQFSASVQPTAAKTSLQETYPGQDIHHVPSGGVRTVAFRRQSPSDVVGVNLWIRPYIGLVSAEVDVELSVSDVVGYQPSGEPIIEERFYSTTMEMQDGVPVELAQLDKKSNVESTNGIPYLSSIPWIGKYVFGHTTKTEQQKKIVVQMIPTFQVHTMDEATPVEMVRVAQQLAKGQAAISIPGTDFGYDQWLLD